jgi:phosphoglycerate dehydrogenase-like enzyme
MNEPIQILITLPFTDDLLAKIQTVSPRLQLNLVHAHKVEEVPNEDWRRTEVLYTNRVLPNPELVPNLRWIQFHWAGVDHVMEHPLLHMKEVEATTLSGAAASQVAEYAVMMLLSLGRRMAEMMSCQRKGEWPKDRWERFSPRELRDSTVGVLGYGSVGRQIARLLLPFGAIVLATKRDVMHPEDKDYMPPGMGDQNADYVYRLYPSQAVRSMIKECDFVVNTLPLTPQNRNLIGAEELAVMKPTAYFLDLSRGGVVNQNALISALREHKIAGAALDVFPEEPLPQDNPLWKLSNVIITPHISGNTPYYDQRAVELFVENLRRYISSQPLLNRFDPARMY